MGGEGGGELVGGVATGGSNGDVFGGGDTIGGVSREAIGEPGNDNIGISGESNDLGDMPAGVDGRGELCDRSNCSSTGSGGV